MLTVVVAAMLACESLTEIVAHENYEAHLSGSAVRPDTISTTGAGDFHATLTSDTSVMTYTLSFGGLSSAATSAHIHGPAKDSVVAGILVDLAAPQLGTSGNASGSIDLARAVTPTVSGDSLRRLLTAGLLYIDVHTSSHSGGEIRGQIRK